MQKIINDYFDKDLQLKLLCIALVEIDISKYDIRLALF